MGIKPSEITREYIAGILCAMQVAGDDEASAAIEKFIVQLEEDNAALKRENEAFGDFANTIAYTSDGKRRSSLGLTFTKALEDLRNALLTAEESE